MVSRRLLLASMLCAMGCDGESEGNLPEETGTTPQVQRTWTSSLPDTSTLKMGGPLRPVRSVFHTHTPYSHDACDGEGWKDGSIDLDCQGEVRRGLCETAYDVAFLTDHPDHGDTPAFEELFLGAKTLERVDGGIAAGWMDCDGGHRVQIRAGYEDELMPVGLTRHVDADPEVRHRLLNQDDAEAMQAMQAAGGRVLVAHTESRPVEHLMALQDLGLHGLEGFNVHAMFAPDIRSKYLGLSPSGFAEDLGRFTRPGSEAEPDLYFLTVLEEQSVSLAKWDALLARGPMMVTAGTDAHRNILPLPMTDGERVDSFRRAFRWFSTWLMATDTSVAAVDEALNARRSYVVFEALGTPEGLDVYGVDASGARVEVGGEGAITEIVVSCPTLSVQSPQGEVPPEISVEVWKDGELWQSSCGTFPVSEGVFRMVARMRPQHLRPFLTGVEDLSEKTYPWVYSGALRVQGL